MVLFHIEYKNSLKLCMKLYSELIDRYTTITLPLNSFNHGSTVQISHRTITYTMYLSFLKYEIIFNYENRNITNLTMISYVLSHVDNIWVQNVDDDIFLAFIEPTITHIRLQVQQYFHRIHHRWRDTDYECVSDPSWYKRIRSFEQLCTSKTALYVKHYVDHLKYQSDITHYYKKKLEKRIFKRWKEWFFSPNNKTGYVSIIKRKYNFYDQG